MENLANGWYKFPEEIRYSYYSLKPDKDDTDDIKVVKVKTLYHLRHDLIHFACIKCTNLQLNLGTTQKMKDIVGTIDEDFKNLSPDIIFENDGIYYIIDISVSRNRQFNLEEKKAKYLPLLKYLNNENFDENQFFFAWLNPDYTNVEQLFSELQIFLELSNQSYYPLSKDFKTSLKIVYATVTDLILDYLRQIPESLFFNDEPLQPKAFELVEDIIRNEKQESKFEILLDIENHLKDKELLDAENYFDSLINDEDVYKKLDDTEHNPDMYERAFKKIQIDEDLFPKRYPKPSFFIPFADASAKLRDTIEKTNFPKQFCFPENTFRIEQQQVLKMLCFISENMLNDNVGHFCKDLLYQFNTCLKYPTEQNLFNTGLFTNDIDMEEALNNEFFKYKKDNNTSMSKRSFFKNILRNDTESLRDTLPYIYKNKCIRTGSLSMKSREFVERSGTAYKKHHNVREYKEKFTVDRKYENSLENFMTHLETPTNVQYVLNDILTCFPGVDSVDANNLKIDSLKKFKNYLEFIKQYRCHTMLKHTSLAASQILHFNEMNTTENTYYLFTGGHANIIHIVKGGSQKRGDDIGQAFFTIFVTDNVGWCNEVFGKIKKIEVRHLPGTYICVTPWVRLTSERLTFMRDQYYSVLSTSYDTWSRLGQDVNNPSAMRHYLTFRSCVAFSPSQQVAEFLMDTRYIFMSALSKFSNIEQLIIDKFHPPYKNCFELYIVTQLRKKSQEIHRYLQLNPPKPKKPGFSQGKRLEHTLGGDINVPSLWSDLILSNVQNIFDDIFVYVHTSKEPSSEYHEQVRAINTILKYQYEYDDLTSLQKHGFFTTEDFKKHILENKQVGCSSLVVNQSSKLFSKNFENLNKTSNFKKNILFEPLSQIVSTKSCIPEVDRNYKEIEYTAKQRLRLMENIKSFTISGKYKYIDKDIEQLGTYTVLDVDINNETTVISKQGRLKVHDALYEWMKNKGKDANYVWDLATWNIVNNDLRVISDTCIKAQYGAKREFYVINLGAKAMARVTENSYKEIAKLCKSEMISVPGDRKLVNIQDQLNNVILSSERHKDCLLYVNGDCTKWSACETMASFISMNLGLSTVFGDKVTFMNNCTFSAWAHKDIQIPSSILQSLRFKTNTTNYINDTKVIKSTQNFLQGMFNYASSLKAVIATEFALHMYKKNHPSKFISCQHLEHSDDYCLVVRTSNIQDFKLFRVYHKLSQKLHGINDSIKKTNIQHHIQEFISLFSFNGQLYYPHIKKTKEVGTNLSCINYRGDVMSVVSRVTECVRIGVPLSICYAVQRIHSANIADVYSLSKGMRNAPYSSVELFSTPLELFGLPDCFPLVSVTVKGNADNYRLYKFGGNEVKKVLKVLYLMSEGLETILDINIKGLKDDTGDLFKPIFSYPKRNRRIKSLRDKLSMGYEESVQYFEDNKTDMILKPVESSRFLKWLQAMYYNRTFTEAYMRVSRATMALRHSNFSSKPCIMSIKTQIKLATTHDTVDIKYLTIKKFKQEFQEIANIHSLKCLNDNQYKTFKEIINCFNNGIEIFYNLIDNSTMFETYMGPIPTTVSRMPDPFQWISLENNISDILQYKLNYSNFIADRKNFLNETSILRDVKKLNQFFDFDRCNTDRNYLRRLFKEITSQSYNKAYGLSYTTENLNLIGYYKQYLERGLTYETKYKLVTKNITEIYATRGETKVLINDWQRNLDSLSKLLGDYSLLFRCIILQSNDNEFDYNVTKLLSLKNDLTNQTLNEILNQTCLEDLERLKAGDMTRRCLVFLKMKLLNDEIDLLNYIKSKFFYEYRYIRDKRHFPEDISESVTCKFMNVNFTGYLCKKTKIVIMEIDTRNITQWYYCYTILQRLFGLISQYKFDSRMVENTSFSIPKIGKEVINIMNEFPKNPDTLHFQIINNTILESNLETANLPIICRKHKGGNISLKKQLIENRAALSLGALDVKIGHVTVFRLPFGHLPWFGSVNSNTIQESNIMLNHYPLHKIVKYNLLEKMLKCDYGVHLNNIDAKDLLLDIGEDINNKPYKEFCDINIFEDNRQGVLKYEGELLSNENRDVSSVLTTNARTSFKEKEENVLNYLEKQFTVDNNYKFFKNKSLDELTQEELTFLDENDPLDDRLIESLKKQFSEQGIMEKTQLMSLDIKMFEDLGESKNNLDLEVAKETQNLNKDNTNLIESSDTLENFQSFANLDFGKNLNVENTEETFEVDFGNLMGNEEEDFHVEPIDDNAVNLDFGSLQTQFSNIDIQLGQPSDIVLLNEEVDENIQSDTRSNIEGLLTLDEGINTLNFDELDLQCMSNDNTIFEKQEESLTEFKVKLEEIPNFDLNLKSFEPLEDEDTTKQDNCQQTINNLGINFDCISNISNQQNTNLDINDILQTRSLYETFENTNKDIENLRDFDLGQETVELLLDTPLMEPKDEQWDDDQLDDEVSSSNSSSSSSGNLNWYTLTPRNKTFDQQYGFEKRCREELKDVSFFLTTSLIKPMFKELTSNVSSLSNCFKFIKMLRTTTFEKAKGKDINLLKNIIMKGLNSCIEIGDTYISSNSLGLTKVNDKLKILYCYPFNERQAAIDHASKSNSIKFVDYVANSSSGFHWTVRDANEKVFNKIMDSYDMNFDFTQYSLLHYLTEGFKIKIPEMPLTISDSDFD